MLFGLINRPIGLINRPTKRKLGKVEFEPQIRLYQLLILQYICQHGNKTVLQLAAKFDLTPAAVSYFGDVMQCMGYITFTAGLNDDGIYVYNATVEGHALVLAASHQLAEYLVWACEKLPNVTDDMDFDDMYPHLPSLL